MKAVQGKPQHDRGGHHRETTSERQTPWQSIGISGMRNFISDRALSEKAALFLDVDGTMIDFAASPAEVFVPAKLIQVLDALERRLCGALALISGRTVAELDRLFRPLSLRAGGVHGAEMRYEPVPRLPTVEAARVLSANLWRSLNEMLDEFPGVFAENKRYSFAIHYRASPDLGPRLLNALRAFVVASGEDEWEIISAHFAFEIKGSGFDKGAAIEQFLARSPFTGRVPIFIGDDWTDESGFAAVARVGGTAYSVGEARPHVSGVFPDPASVREWLELAAAQMAPS